MKAVLDTFAGAGVPVVFGRRSSSGLLLVALGAAGFSLGEDAIHQNFAPHPEVREEGGGRAADWYYAPRLLNSIKMETRRDIVERGLGHLIECNCPYCAQLFGADAAQTITTTAERVLLVQHNVYALRQQAARLGSLSPLERLQRMRIWVNEALAAYGALPAAWAAGEGPGFLDTWAALL